MRDFFHGWRRKAGCVALVMACLFMAGWIRSRMFGDAFLFPVGSRQNAIVALDGAVHWCAVKTGPAYWGFETSDRPVDELADQLQTEIGFSWCVPYWSITIPLTLLSAYLILRKPRKSAANMPTADGG